jgi:predicted TIM-barrel fold metal-dependent hydrolase
MGAGAKRPGIDLDSVEAIDFHVHAEVSVDGRDPMPPELRAASQRYFRGGGGTPTVEDVAAYYRERRMACVVFTVDWGERGAAQSVSNDEVAEVAAANPDVLIPFASIHPARPGAAEEAQRLIEERAVRGFKFHPNVQDFFPNDRLAYPLYEVIEAAGLPALFHTGHSGIGSGLPGGGGLRLKYSNPIYVDDVAADFPGMPIVLAHPSFPWQDEALSIAMHKPEVHIDLSGWSPKYFPPQLVRYANTLLKRQVLFGSDYPMITPERWLRDFEQLEIDPEVRPLILKDNAARLLGLDRNRTETIM